MKEKKLWSGRFTKNVSDLVEQFTESISFDSRLALYDVKASIAHTKMLERSNIISKSDAARILSGLKKIDQLIQNNKLPLKKEHEDIHMNIESLLTKMIGESAKKLHTARSRNDQVLVDVVLYLKDIVSIMNREIRALQKVIIIKAEKNKDIMIPGYTHMKQAQVVLVSHYLMAYFNMFQRDKERFEQLSRSLDILPLGTGALAGVNYDTDRNLLAKLLGFSQVSENSMDTVSNRDFMIEFISHCSILSMHFSRMAEDLIIFNTDEFEIITIDDSFTTGSSIMPNKKNPDVLELIRGKTGLIYGDLVSLLTLLKGLPLTYNRDLQEDKKIIFRTIDTILPILQIAPALLKNIKFNTHAINKKMRSGFLLATDLADHLVKSGTPFREAHCIVGKIIGHCVEKKLSLFDLDLKDFQQFSNKFDHHVLALLDYKHSIQSKRSYGSTSFKSVKNQIKKAKRLIQ